MMSAAQDSTTSHDRSGRTIILAACHAAPVYLDEKQTTSKALQLIDAAAIKGASIIAFPEAFIPGFPLYAGILSPLDHGNSFSEYVRASIYVDGPEINALREKCKEKHVCVSMGFSERSHVSTGCIWNSNIIIDATGEIISHHRKLMPTFWEKLVWSPGDGNGLRVGEWSGTRAHTGNVDTTAQPNVTVALKQHRRHGLKVGALICGENTNPLSRYALMAQGEQIHVAPFPPCWPTSRPMTGKSYPNKKANATRAAAHSFEAKCFTIVCAGYISQEMKDAIATVESDKEVRSVLDGSAQAQSCFFGPSAEQIGDSLEGEEGIAFATLGTESEVEQTIVEAKRLHDVVGGYQRYDIFDLEVIRRRDEPVAFTESSRGSA